MITAVVQFPLAEGTTLAEAQAIFESTAPRYLGLAGLIRKNYLFDPETCVGGGCYTFENRAAAEALYNDAWRALIREKYGADPEVRFFETPVMVDNVSNEIITETP
ncbi:monooxygenase [Rhodalgimonas zhirmunskyi]|uniref:YdhR family protein n=1 Tax=Rhodalgimonas zhirmunskyi TaxID=2964767 RepID=A0AAJ1X8C6_9RHOB|nr:monooxygenase [Rhodoalgimonas zhirmunskyi]MDQ2095467.1 YdhR family protein [Rhodoalgimonas zhirmunskyi]